jgi:hypothetical protein
MRVGAAKRVRTSMHHLSQGLAKCALGHLWRPLKAAFGAPSLMGPAVLSPLAQSPSSPFQGARGPLNVEREGALGETSNAQASVTLTGVLVFLSLAICGALASAAETAIKTMPDSSMYPIAHSGPAIPYPTSLCT